MIKDLAVMSVLVCVHVMISFVVMVVGAIHLSLAVLAATQVPVRTATTAPVNRKRRACVFPSSGPQQPAAVLIDYLHVVA